MNWRATTHFGGRTDEMSVSEFLKLWPDPTVQVVDVREGNEWISGHIAGSVHMPLGDVRRRLAELDPLRPVVTVCRSGRRSLISARELQQAGFADVKSLAGGVIAWAEAGQPLEA
jgi:rhodanese-related sulfurtransferase